MHFYAVPKDVPPAQQCTPQVGRPAGRAFTEERTCDRDPSGVRRTRRDAPSAIARTSAARHTRCECAAEPAQWMRQCHAAHAAVAAGWRSYVPLGVKRNGGRSAQAVGGHFNPLNVNPIDCKAGLYALCEVGQGGPTAAANPVNPTAPFIRAPSPAEPTGFQSDRRRVVAL